MPISILNDANCKLRELRKYPKWATELPPGCPPILWFGNAESSKPKVLTIGANPSRKEFLSDTSVEALEKVRKQISLSYLEPPHNRFAPFESSPQELIDSYNSYFLHNPYRKWFGHDKDDSYNVEGFLRGFGASYYQQKSIPKQAIHIDLIPFATLSDFSQIQGLVKESLFSTGWARGLLARLVEYLSPTVLILFGLTNCGNLPAVDPSMPKIAWNRNCKGKYSVGEWLDVPLVYLSTNLGNPKGFNAMELREYGRFVRGLLEDKTLGT